MNNNIEIYKLQDMIRQIERLNNDCTDNMKRLNQMILELKGIVAMVRPQVKKSGWYGDELNANPDFRESTKLIYADMSNELKPEDDSNRIFNHLVGNLPLNDTSK